MTDRRERRATALERFERAVELPLLVLALVMVPLIVVPLFVDLDDGAAATVEGAEWFIWAAFAFEYVTRLALTPARWRFVRREWPDLLIIALPFLRPLRVVRSARGLRLLRLGRLAAVLAESTQEARRLLLRHRLHYALLATGLVVVGSAGLVYAVEEAEADATIHTFGDALWWAITTVTTVGYGDRYPITAAGRGVAAFLMLTGIAFFGVITANLAAFLLERGTPDEPSELVVLRAKLDQVLAQIALLNAPSVDTGALPPIDQREA